MHDIHLLRLNHFLLHRLFQLVEHRAQFPLLFTWNRLEIGHQILDFAFASQEFNAKCLYGLRTWKFSSGHLGHHAFDAVLHVCRR